jgi:hypothetical protein
MKTKTFTLLTLMLGSLLSTPALAAGSVFGRHDLARVYWRRYQGRG